MGLSTELALGPSSVLNPRCLPIPLIWPPGEMEVLSTSHCADEDAEAQRGAGKSQGPWQSWGQVPTPQLENRGAAVVTWL